MNDTKKISPPFFSVGITGGIGSGKSTIARLFAEKGAEIVEMDEIAHQLTAPDGKAMEAISKTFGEEFVNPDGSLNRAHMRELVFQDASARKKLEAILHPMIKEEAKKQARHSKGKYIIYVIPLLTEQVVWQDMPDRILLVDCPEEIQIERVMIRNKMTKEQVKAIMAAQASRSERLAIADDIILNDTEMDKLLAKVTYLDSKYKKFAEKASSGSDLN